MNYFNASISKSILYLYRQLIYVLFLFIVFSCAVKQEKKKDIKEIATAISKPNVIFILVDDLGYSDIACYGAKKVKTPNLDRLALEGLQFTDFYTGASICSPSRAAFLTGAYPQRCGLYMGINPKREPHWFLGLNPEEVTIAEQFKKQDYKTMIVGKWHLGTEAMFLPTNQGFDNYYGMPSNFNHDPRFFDEDEVLYEKTPLNKLTELYTSRVTKFINENKSNPFFLYYSHNYPHTPYEPGEKFKGSSDDGIRGDVIQELDWSIGQVIKTLEKNGILDNTIIIFTSDNGPVKNEYALPYRGTKFKSLEGGHRVPFIINWKGKINNPRKIDEQITAMDVFPSLSEVINEPLPSDKIYDGVSFKKILDNKPFERNNGIPFYYYNAENLQAIRYQNWKLHLPREKEQMPWWDKRPSIETPKLYNLDTDIKEKFNLADEKQELVIQMTKMANDIRFELGEYKQRGSEQRPTGNLFPDVSVITNPVDWNTLSDEEKGKAKRKDGQ